MPPIVLITSYGFALKYLFMAEMRGWRYQRPAVRRIFLISLETTRDYFVEE